MSAESSPPDESPPSGNDPETSSDAAPLPEPVWTYRGYQLRASEFTTAMVHFFRAEVQRANVWRQRLDMTFNWAVVTTAAALSFAFGGAGNHAVIILDLLLVTMFLYIEARRYRYYELWSYRVRLMETDFFAAMLVPPFHPAPDWAETLAGHLLHPTFPISAWEAFGRRLRRNYLWIYAIILLAWMVKVSLQPVAIKSWTGFVARAAIGGLPGEVVSIIVGLSFVALVIVSVLTIGLHAASGEVLPRFGGKVEEQRAAEEKGVRAWFRPSRRRQQFLVLVITDRAASVAERILKEMRRGVTSMPGIGMYTGKAHSVLMCALTTTEVPQLKALVAVEDPNAFVIVSPAQDVFGKGFMPLSDG